MAAFKELFGESLQTKDGNKPTEEVLNGKTAVGIYFSAHWCPPCRSFTPKLADMYSKNFKAKGMEIVFVSSDSDEGSFASYYGEQPWCALPYEKRDLKESLSKKFKVKGIPSFVILGADGAVITMDGREAVSEDPEGKNYPWIPPTAEEKAKEILNALGPDLVEKTAGKFIGLYFSAHWCPPCRGFTPKLAEWYKGSLKDKMEIIFVSSDRDKKSFDEYFGEMPWLALPYENSEAKKKLSSMCDVEGIPHFAVLNPDGTILTTDGRSKVSADPTGATLPEGWLPQPFNDVNDDPSGLNEEQCLIALGSSEAMAAAVKAVAAEFFEAAGKDASAMPLRFYKGPDGGIVAQVRKLTKVEGDKLILLDIPSDGAFYVCDNTSPSVDDVKAFIDDVKTGKADKKTLEK